MCHLKTFHGSGCAEKLFRPEAHCRLDSKGKIANNKKMHVVNFFCTFLKTENFQHETLGTNGTQYWFTSQ
jgi:hypothetical protein